MPNKTIYISDNDLPLADRAAELAGGLSPAVVEGLKLYLRNNAATERGFEEVHVVDRTDGVETRKVFQGRQLARLSQSLDGKRVEWTSYLTPKENIAVVRSEHPDFVAVARGAGAAGPNADRGASSFFGSDATPGSSHSRTSGRARNPEDITTDVIDFARRTFDEATGRGSRGAHRPKFDIDLSYWMNSANQIFNDLATGFERGVTEEQDSPRSSDDSRSSSQTGSDSQSGSITSSSGFGAPVDHRRDSSATSDNSHTPEKVANESQAPFVRDAWAAHHELEVFSNLEELKEAAFRNTKTVPAPFISATERALGTPETEYLDI
ncbi:EXLDI protein [uncultured Corynebacterium sp.]|uniref:EXLDI protein n=1 Tax=uncultured Corynebacterium sp. TaxID=159447 RepID=UPI0025E71BD6|nr:EXLDI protein [uncultured Corynebacterium sp.]